MNINNINMEKMNFLDNMPIKMGIMDKQMPKENNLLNKCQMNMKNNQNNIIKEVVDEEECPGDKISIIFNKEIDGEKTVIITSRENTMENLLKKYIQKRFTS